MISLFKNYIDKRVDKRINEIINDDTLSFRNISDSKARQEMSSFIVEKKDRGVTKLSTLDFVLSLKLPAEQIEKVLDNYKKEKRIKEIK